MYVCVCVCVRVCVRVFVRVRSCVSTQHLGDQVREVGFNRDVVLVRHKLALPEFKQG